MSRTISEAIYLWMLEKRITTDVATEMGKSVSTLSAELRPTRSNAKLGADDLVPLFDAIREVGYGRELDGIMFSFIADLKGESRKIVAGDDVLSEVLRLTSGVSAIFHSASNASGGGNSAELTEMLSTLHAEVLPAALQLERILTAKIKSCESAAKSKHTKSSLTSGKPAPNQ
jgi:hypothetical protein